MWSYIFREVVCLSKDTVDPPKPRPVIEREEKTAVFRKQRYISGVILYIYYYIINKKIYSGHRYLVSAVNGGILVGQWSVLNVKHCHVHKVGTCGGVLGSC